METKQMLADIITKDKVDEVGKYNLKNGILSTLEIHQMNVNSRLSNLNLFMNSNVTCNTANTS